MNKTFLSILLLFYCSLNLYSQKLTKGSFSVLKNEKIVNIELDYSGARIDGYSFVDFVESEANWERDLEDITQRVAIEANNALKGKLTITNNVKADYLLVFKAKEVDDDGETDGMFLLFDNRGDIIGVIDDLNADGGNHGSQVYLMSLSAERIGKKFGKYLKRLLGY